MWKVFTMGASFLGWEGVLDAILVQGIWLLEEAWLPINIPNIVKFRAVWLFLQCWSPHLSGHPMRMWAVVHFNYQGGTRSCVTQKEVDFILPWAELHVPTLSTVHIPGIENWQTGHFRNWKTFSHPVPLCLPLTLTWCFWQFWGHPFNLSGIFPSLTLSSRWLFL